MVTINLHDRGVRWLMSETYGKGGNYFYKLWQRFMGQVIQDVPEDYQACVFECRKLLCALGDWKMCVRRLRAKVHSHELS
jgi:hypothetical protein